jgi:RNA polymerase sigma factor (sigma-70 family)
MPGYPLAWGLSTHSSLCQVGRLLTIISLLDSFTFNAYGVALRLMDLKQEQHVRLWNAFKAGDWDAYTSLYHAYFRLLNNYGYKFTRDVKLIEDVIHDLFVNLWTNRENLGNPFSVRNYLYKAVRNMLFRKIRNQSRFSDLTETDDHVPFEVSFDHQLILNEEQKRIQDTLKSVLNQLPPRQREIVYLRFYDSLSYEEIADIMGINVSSTYKLLYKALENLQQSLGAISIAALDLLFHVLTSPSGAADRAGLMQSISTPISQAG